MSYFLGDNISPNVRKLVWWLNENGFKTTDSGDGSNYEAGMEGACPFLMVAITVEHLNLVPESDRLCRLLNKCFGITFECGSIGPNIEASYNPGDSSACIVLTYVTDIQMIEKDNK